MASKPDSIANGNRRNVASAESVACRNEIQRNRTSLMEQARESYSILGGTLALTGVGNATMLAGMSRFRAAATWACALCVVLGCAKSATEPVPEAARTYVMGFSWFPPRPELPLALQVIEHWLPRADAALLLTSPPWDSLLAGHDPSALVRANQLGLAEHYRSRGLRLVVSVDPTNGLDRATDAPELVAAGRSLAEPAVQELYREFVVALDTLVRPEWLAIASETNLVRAIAPDSLYSGLQAAANQAALAIRAVDGNVKLFITVQVEVAWGRPAGGFAGVTTDRADFPFTQALGLSSFPYLGGTAAPESLPLDYYSRLADPDEVPLLVIEGGWPSEPVAGIPSTPDLQRRYLARHAQLLGAGRARAWFQINFTDLEVAAWPAGIEPFSRLGLVTTSFAPKPALAVWDSLFALQGP
jgi:hypothetical protein